eukprot:1157161-Pelagomonas_calceolata.AAC.12
MVKVGGKEQAVMWAISCHQGRTLPQLANAPTNIAGAELCLQRPARQPALMLLVCPILLGDARKAAGSYVACINALPQSNCRSLVPVLSDLSSSPQGTLSLQKCSLPQHSALLLKTRPPAPT